ncbi:uncharacterized protein C8Q71DRAFT_712914, partial [Rhodofomes roseus]
LRGFGRENPLSQENKWMHVNQLMREKRIVVLVVQETHMDDTRRAMIETVFGQRLSIHSSADEVNPTGKGGVAIVLNKDVIQTTNVKTHIVKAGRALQVQISMKNDTMGNILGIYAPNDPTDNEYLWEDIKAYYESPCNRRIPKPDLLLVLSYIIKDEVIQEYIRERGKQAMTELIELGGWRFADENPQRILHSFKSDVRDKAIERQRAKIPTLI